MRWRIVIAVSAAILLCQTAEAFGYRLEETRRMSFPVGTSPRLEIENVNGSIWVESWEGSSIEVTAEIRIKAPSKSKARTLHKGIELVTEGDAERVSVKTILPRVRQDAFPGLAFGEYAAIRVRYRIKVPRGTSLAVTTVNGDIELALPAEALEKASARTAHGRVTRTPIPR